MRPLAHSARPSISIPEQAYSDHIESVSSWIADCFEHLRHQHCDDLRQMLLDSAEWHDLGKLDPENQRVLRSNSGLKLAVQHECAGVQHLRDTGRGLAAILVYAHHRGLPDFSRVLFENMPLQDWDANTLRRCDELRSALVSEHLATLCSSDDAGQQSGDWRIEALRKTGLFWRMCLSCLVDADHSDTAQHYGSEIKSGTAACRWEERIQSLDRYVSGLEKASTAAPNRNRIRAHLYEECRHSEREESLVTCESGVGTGKTTAVMAHLLRVAEKRELNHIFVVLPFTNIINQSVEVYRGALVLEGEQPERIIAAHHHQVDFETRELRQLATLWDAPIIVTTAVQFFSTLAACRTGGLRKLHELAGSAVFVDKSHAALPPWLWPLSWQWVKELTTDWGCHFVLGSGSLARFWELPKFANPPETVPDLLSPHSLAMVQAGEQGRVTILNETDRLTFEDLEQRVAAKGGSALIIVNTIYTAAVLARYLRGRGQDVLHLSTALAPDDRDNIIDVVRSRLQPVTKRNWILVATSCVEAGMDFSFDTGWREACATTSVIQASGRVNRHGQSPTGEMRVFRFDDARAQPNADARVPAAILEQLLLSGEMKTKTAAAIATRALQVEIEEKSEFTAATNIKSAERKKNFPEVAELYRVIDDDSVLVIVEPALTAFREGHLEKSSELMRGSVRVRKSKVKQLGLMDLSGGNEELYGWDRPYSAEFLGYMEGILDQTS